MKFMERVIGMFKKPEETIKDILKEPRTEEPIVIVGIYAIIALISSYISSIHMGTSISVITVVISLVMAFVGWVIATGVIHVFALFLGGEGKFNPQMLNAIGYTYIVKIIPLLIGMVLLFFLPTINLGTPQVTPNMSPDQIKGVMQPYITMMETYYFNPIFILSIVIGYLGLLWSCYLGTLAVKEGYKVSKITSYIVVFVPAAIYIIFSLLALYGSYFLLKMMYG